MLRTAHHEPMAAIERGDLGASWLKAIDFGCSQVIRRTPLSRRAGTPVYMAPEVSGFQGRKGYGLRSFGRRNLP